MIGCVIFFLTDAEDSLAGKVLVCLAAPVYLWKDEEDQPTEIHYCDFQVYFFFKFIIEFQLQRAEATNGPVAEKVQRPNSLRRLRSLSISSLSKPFKQLLKLSSSNV